jgi:cytochrome c-type biogenesis protein CcmH
MFRKSASALLVALALVSPALAVEPDEILKDASLEARARNLSAGLRCLVCQNQSIDDSAAPVARDLRILIREQLLQNKSDAEVMDFVVARYGDYVLLRPRFTAQTLLLWLTPFALLILGAGFLLRKKTGSPQRDQLSADEQAALDKILKT